MGSDWSQRGRLLEHSYGSRTEASHGANTAQMVEAGCVHGVLV
jgi:hypothetical protein